MKTKTEILAYLRNLEKIKDNSIQKDVAIKILKWVLEDSLILEKYL